MNLNHLYVSPVEKCNLACKICYTKKNKTQLSFLQIADFVSRFQTYLVDQTCDQELESVTLCGGEVFLLDWLPKLVNQLNQQKVIVQIITNGTVNRLAEFLTPNLINLIISLDGLPQVHDQNRGKGSFNKTWQFLLSALKNKFHFEIFSVVTNHNFHLIDQFEHYLQTQLGFLPKITYHPRKPTKYLNKHPVHNVYGQVNEFEFLSFSQLQQLAINKTVFPPIDLGCHQLAVMSDGHVYACCEGINSLGKISDPISQLVTNYQTRIKVPPKFDQHCRGCIEPQFGCGFLSEYAKIAAPRN